ncbi:MAG TPA: tRNA lysidine(34) synthetase TilS [Gammaproteobacteria bacterium]|nr:tRNA lysidine(34) synthetase TilS [Gammaproteobacteria bacterium]
MKHSAETSDINSLDIDCLIQYLTQLAAQYNIKSWCLAYSGGVDSQVLLHLLHLTKFNLLAVYIDHGLQAASAGWAEHCERQCQQLNIPFRVISVNAEPQKGEGPEAAARNARYAALKEIIQTDMCLLTAQHQQDQAETVLLQLLRGGSAAGLAAMPQICSFENGWHSRPLLNVSQQAILDYAEKNSLSWVEDPSNLQQNYDRNFLRLSIIPALEQRWPALSKTLSVFSKQQAENSQLLEALAEIDLQQVQIEKSQLDVKSLQKLDNARLRNALRYWFKTAGYPLPSRLVLQQIIDQMVSTADGTGALVSWADIEVRYFRHRLYCLKKVQHDASKIYGWDGAEPLVIESTGQRIQFTEIRQPAEKSFVLNSDILKSVLSIRFRQGGERIQPAGRGGHHHLKTLFQEAGVPPWQRDRIPLLYVGDQLAAVVGYWLADEFAVKGEGAGIQQC